MSAVIRLDKNLQVPAIVTMSGDKCDIHVPDLKITVHGQDYVEAMANAMLNVSAIYYYNHDRNIPIQLTKTYAEVEREACNRRNGSFATYLSLTT